MYEQEVLFYVYKTNHRFLNHHFKTNENPISAPDNDPWAQVGSNKTSPILQNVHQRSVPSSAHCISPAMCTFFFFISCDFSHMPTSLWLARGPGFGFSLAHGLIDLNRLSNLSSWLRCCHHVVNGTTAKLMNVCRDVRRTNENPSASFEDWWFKGVLRKVPDTAWCHRGWTQETQTSLKLSILPPETSVCKSRRRSACNTRSTKYLPGTSYRDVFRLFLPA